MDSLHKNPQWRVEGVCCTVRFIYTVRSVVYDRFVKHVLVTSPRFSEVRVLSLEGCAAVTGKVLRYVAERCPFLEVVLLTHCYQIEQDAILEFASKMKNLRKLELYGCDIDGAFIDQLREIHPGLDFGFVRILVRFGTIFLSFKSP